MHDLVPGPRSGRAPGGERTRAHTDETELGRERGRYRSGDSLRLLFANLFSVHPRSFLQTDTGPMCALQVFEGKQRLWEKEVEELKRLYAAKLRQVSQHAQRSQRGLQLQLFKAQQEKNRLQEELNRLRRERGEESGASSNQVSPTLEETQWKVKVLRGQKKRGESQREQR